MYTLYIKLRIETENLGVFTATDGRSENCSRAERVREQLILIEIQIKRKEMELDWTHIT